MNKTKIMIEMSKCDYPGEWYTKVAISQDDLKSCIEVSHWDEDLKDVLNYLLKIPELLKWLLSEKEKVKDE